MSEGSRARRYPPPLPFRLRRRPWFLSPRRISSRNFGGICSARARSAIRTGSSGSPSASASRALMAYLAFFESMGDLVGGALKYSRAARRLLRPKARLRRTYAIGGGSSRLTNGSHGVGTENLVVHRQGSTHGPRQHEFLLVALSRT